jgi:hypothetical protein
MTTSAETHKAIGTKRSIVSAVRVVFSTSSFSSLDPIIVAMGELPLSLFSIVSLSLSLKALEVGGLHYAVKKRCSCS